jgi:N-acetylglucosamine-6-phosphate deacetylase
MTVLAGARIVTPDGVIDDGWIETRGAQIVAVGTGEPPETAVDLAGSWVVPGFIDLHVHGGGGYDFTTSAADLAAGVDYHLHRGTTRTLVSLMAAPIESLCRQLGWVADLSAGGSTIAGAHLEGPFLAHSRCGAQNSDYLRPPDNEVLAALIAAGRGHLKSMTFAPELPGAIDLVPQLVAGGVVAAVGHTDADYNQAIAAFAAGATLVTHLFNAMRPSTHRQPGPAVAAVEAGAMCEIVNDGVHVHDAVTRLASRLLPSNLVLITDAISATGAGDGSYVLGDQGVTVVGGEARLTSSGRLAGSTLTMDEAFRRAIVDIGLSIQQAVVAASSNPARLLGLSGRCGAIAPGLDADLVVLDEKYVLQQVITGGRVLADRS